MIAANGGDRRAKGKVKDVHTCIVYISVGQQASAFVAHVPMTMNILKAFLKLM
jgi:hypothetical protein